MFVYDIDMVGRVNTTSYTDLLSKFPCDLSSKESRMAFRHRFMEVFPKRKFPEESVETKESFVRQLLLLKYIRVVED